MNSTTPNTFPRDFKSLWKLFSWGLFEWATSSFHAVVITFVFAAYFTHKVAVNDIIGTHQWGDALAISGIFVAILSPIFGAIADFGGYRKIWLMLFTLFGVTITGLLWFAYPDPTYVTFTLTVIILANLAIEIAVVFYNAMLADVAPRGFLGRISGWAWGMGYFGGLSCLSTMLFFMHVHPTWLGNSAEATLRFTGPLVAIWVLIFSLPLFLFVEDPPHSRFPFFIAIQKGLQQLKNSLQRLPQKKNLFLFLIARMIYTDGLNTLFAFGGIYAAGTFGMNMTSIMIFGILLNITAGLGAVSFAWLDDWLGSKITILISLAGLILIGIPVLIIHSTLLFWIFAPLLGIFVGPSQAASRTLMARLAPAKEMNEMFGLFSFSGKATAFVGPWLLGLVTLYTQSQRLGMSTIFIFFIVGGLLLLRVKDPHNA